MRLQRTLKNKISFEGIGLHSGEKTKIELFPLEENAGIVFYSKKYKQKIEYKLENVVNTVNNISIGNNKFAIKTVEHLTASLYAMEIDNCLIECDGEEIPILDGSASEFIKGLQAIGIVEQSIGRKIIKITYPVWHTSGDKFIVALPYDGFKINYTISFPDSPIGTQTYTYSFDKESFIKDIAIARTFGFVEDIDNYRKKGLAIGSGLENALVFSKKKNISINEPRCHIEPVKHKILDLIGGLSILNCDIEGFIISYKGGHTIDIAFAKKLAATYLVSDSIKESVSENHHAYA